ncbi:MAG: ATP-dependent DNA helicase RecG, partial [Oscillospiraceae bacterium]|nr:ATP-dependent DNA helicase RecG [Oscillospiraceae bacterium]
RGRVGRGKHQSYCVLFEGAGGETALERLKVLCSTNDGFKIAEEDLRLRGPGDFFGKRQHGLPQLRVADLAADMETLRDAREAAGRVMAEDPGLCKPENAALAAAVRRLLEENLDTLN